MELQLLRERFPDSPLIDKCGDFKSVFFCARTVNNHSYEGRMFVTESVLFFVSSFSSGVSYDTAIEIALISKALIPRKVIPSVHLTLDKGMNEDFTNFHNQNKIVDTLKSLLPSDKVSIDSSHKPGVYPKFNRLISTPSGFHAPKRSSIKPCPYFSRSGFCPRGTLCKLLHSTIPIVLPSYSARMTHVSPDKMATSSKPPGQELMRSISSPAVGNDTHVDNQEERHTAGILLFDREVDSNGLHEMGEDREKTPDPVSKYGSGELVVPFIQSPTRIGDEHRKNALSDIFMDSSHTTGENIPNPPTPPPISGNFATMYSSPPYTYDEDYLVDEDQYSDIEDQLPSVEMPETLRVFLAANIDRADINSGDKVILSSEVLAACGQKQITYPMAFCFRSKTCDKFVHAGVLEFTSPMEQTAYLPQWMFDHLNVSSGEEVEFQHVDLPKGTFVQLQPVSSAWLGVPFEKRMAILEFQLRNFQTLTEGTKVTIVYELNRYTFKVLQCKPAKGISIVDADLSTDVVEPADLNRFHSVEEWQAENIPLSEPIECTVTAGTYRHFVLLSQPGKELPTNLRIEVKNASGDPDLFLCQTCSTPSQSRYTWCDQKVGDCTIHLSSIDKDYNANKSLFAGVISFSEESRFTISFNEESPGVSAGSGFQGTSGSTGHVLRSATSDSTTSNISSSGSVSDIEQNGTSQQSTEANDAVSPPIPPGHEKCAYCGSIMPQLKLLMHERHCAQSTFRCPTCKECFPKSMEKKHELIVHTVLRCECGEELPQLSLHNHQLKQCIKRSVKCQFKWCQLSFPLDQLQDHESMCAKKLVVCPVCSVEVSQLELQIHLEVFHQVAVENLDWTKPISSQLLQFKPKEPNFKCHCGIGFQFEDDLQVHQLTECTPAEFMDSEDYIG